MLATAAVALVFGFASCKEEDDANEMIEGSGSNYTIAYTNGSSETSRGYVSTKTGHDGALVKFTFNSSSTDGGVLGVIWDYNENSTTKKRTFWVLGLPVNRTSNKIEYYVSKYYNVSDINAQNFGVATTASKTTVAELDSLRAAGTACEYDKTAGFKNTGVSTSTSVVSIWADIYPTLKDTANAHVAGTEDSRNDYTGGFTVKLYKEDPAADTSAQAIATIDIPVNDTEYETVSDLNDKKYAVYANVYGNKSLNGAWTLQKDYHASEVIEDAE